MPQGRASSELNLGVCDSGHARVEMQPDLASFEGCLSFGSIEGSAAGKDFITNLNEVNQGTALQQVRQFAGQLDTGWAGPDDDKSSIGFPLLTQEVNAFPQRGDIIQVVKPLGVLTDSWDTEIVGFRACCQDQISPFQPASLVSGQITSVQIDPVHAFLQPDHLSRTQQVSITRCHFPALHFTAEQLIQVGLKNKVAVWFEHHHRPFRQTLSDGQGAEQSAESTSNHHHGIRRVLWGRHVEPCSAKTIGTSSVPPAGEDGAISEGSQGMMRTLIREDLDAARDRLESLTAPQRLAWAVEQFADGFALTTSFGIQSSVLLHMLSRLPEGHSVPVIWVDTGYLPEETYRYSEQLIELFKVRLVVSQSTISPARMEALHGRLWETGDVLDLETYHRIRKVEPLEQAMADQGVTCWASGVRSSQTDHRRAMSWLDPIRERLSLRPLLDWTPRDIYYYMQEYNLPQHPLFEQGYSTVGDWHSSGPDGGEQSGRETRFGGLKQECGIHLPQDAVEGLMGDGI